MNPRILIVGGGIAGLTTAVALRRRGLEVEVVEQAPAFGAVGAGITIQANAMAVLNALGITLPADDVVPIGEFRMLDGRGKRVMGGDPREIQPDPPSVNIHRADLHRVLLEAAADVKLTAGRTVTRVVPGDADVEVHFADGTAGRWGVVVGADGARSAVRRALLDEQGGGFRYAGQTCWRFACESDRVPTVTTEQWTPGKRAGVVPLSRGRVYVYLVESAPEGTPAPGTDHPDVIRAKFGGQHPDLDPILDRLTPETPIHHGDLGEAEAVHFGRGRVVLIGDAAHAMTPNMGQGAGTAIEDAGELSLLLARYADDPAQIPAALEARRKARVEALTRTAWRLGRVAHWTNPIAAFLRNLLLGLTPQRVMNRQTVEMWRPGIELAERIRRAD